MRCGEPGRWRIAGDNAVREMRARSDEGTAFPAGKSLSNFRCLLLSRAGRDMTKDHRDEPRIREI